MRCAMLAGRINTVGKPRSRWSTRQKVVNEDIVRLISDKNEEPEWMTEWRLEAFARWNKLSEPNGRWSAIPRLIFRTSITMRGPKSMEQKPKSLDEVDPKLLETYAKLGIPLKEQMLLAGVEGAEAEAVGNRKVAVDAVFDSVSVGTTFQAELRKAGVIFCSISEAIKEHPELVQQVSWHGCAGLGQLLCDAEFCSIFRRLVCLYPARGALPDGAVDLFPYQCREHWSI